MKLTTVIASLAACGLFGLACSKEREGVTVTLDGLPGLEADVPAGTRVAKAALGTGVMLKGPGVSMTIGPFRDVDASNLGEAKKNAEAFAPKNVEGEKLSDGYILTYENEGSMGTNYWLVGRRKIEDAAYSCGVRSPEKAHQQNAIAICKSLRK